MKVGLLVFGLIIVFLMGGLMTLRADAKRPLPKNLPPPLKDDEDEDDAAKK
jgi:hypothetical protein